MRHQRGKSPLASIALDLSALLLELMLPTFARHERFDFALTPSRAFSQVVASRHLSKHKTDVVAEVLAATGTLTGWFIPPDGVKLEGLRAIVADQKFTAQRKLFSQEAWEHFPTHPHALESGFNLPMVFRTGWNAVQLQFRDAEGQWHTFCRCRYWLSPFWKLCRLWRRDATLSTYESWLQHHAPSPSMLDEMRAHIAAMVEPPRLSVLMPTYNSPVRWLKRAIRSIQAQVYPHWELCIADDASTDPRVGHLLRKLAAQDSRLKIAWRKENGHICHASNSALELCTGIFTVLFDHDDELPVDALYHIAQKIMAQPDATLIFSDEDKIDEEGRRSLPYFKMSWNYDLLLTENCVSHLGAFRTSVIREIGGFRPGYEGSQDWDLALRVIAQASADSIFHIPRILYHWRILPQSTAINLDAKPYARIAGRNAVAEHLSRQHPGAQVQDVSETDWRIVWPLPEPAPKVSIMLYGKADELTLMQQTVACITDPARTLYPQWEILIPAVFSSILKEAPHARLADQGLIKQVSSPSDIAPFAFNNMAAQQADGEIFLFMRAGGEPASPGWLRELCSQAWRKDSGAAGARLIHPRGKIHHGGIVLGMNGSIGHLFRSWPQNKNSIGGRPDLVREVTAVSAGCLAIRHRTFNQVRGFSSEQPVMYGDVDLCLKLLAAGLHNRCTPFADIVYAQASIPALETGPSDTLLPSLNWLREHWPKEMKADPFYNANLTLDLEAPALRRTGPLFKFLRCTGAAFPMMTGKPSHLLYPPK